MDVIARLPDCEGQAADAGSAHTQESQNVQAYGYVFHDTDGRNPRRTLKIPRHLSNEIQMDTTEQECRGKENSRKFSLEFGWEAAPHWVCLFIEKQGLNGRKEAEYGSHVEDIVEKTLILANTTPFLDRVYLRGIQRECKSNEIIIDEYRKMFESRISAGSN